MILVIDVGNTDTVLGVYVGEELTANWRMTTISNRTADETGMFIHSLFDSAGINSNELNDVIISSVVPNIMYSLTHGIRKYFDINPMIVESGMKTGINLRMENPRELGAARLVNMVAVHEIYKETAIVIDYGTATTFDVVNQKGEFITGVTAPGIQICADALYQRAAQLSKIEIKKPKTIISKTTVSSMQTGIIYSKVGESVYIVKQLKKELKDPNVKVIATGGMARIISESENLFDVFDPWLTLKGLRILYLKNKKNRN